MELLGHIQNIIIKFLFNILLVITLVKGKANEVNLV